MEYTCVIFRKSPEAYREELVLFVACGPYKTGAGFDMSHFDQLTLKLLNISYSCYSETVNYIIYFKIRSFIHSYTSMKQSR